MADTIKDVLVSSRFPIDRITVRIEYKELLSKPIAHTLKLEIENRKVAGTATISINPLALTQDLELMLAEVSYHEVAHLFTKAESLAKSEKYKEHGYEWLEWFQKIMNDDELIPRPLDGFDLRPSLLMSGGVYCKCGCGDENGIVIGLRSKTKLAELKEGDLDCDECGYSYTAASDSVPKKLEEEVAFLKQLAQLRNTDPESIKT